MTVSTVSTRCCKGLITRYCVANGIEEKSVIDFIIISSDLLPLVQSMIIDEDRQFALENIAMKDGEKSITASDHNPINDIGNKFLKLLKQFSHKCF